MDNEPNTCGSCKIRFTSIKKNVGEIKCSFCENWFCSLCSKFRKGDIVGNSAVMSRGDVFWSCDSCLTQAKHLICNKSTPSNTQNALGKNTTLENLDEKLESKIDLSIRNALPDIVKQCMGQIQNQMNETVSKSVSNAWSKTVIGEDDEFPGLNDPESINAPKKPKVTLVSAVKQAVNEKSEEDLRRQSRLTNVILYRIPERNEAAGEERKQKDRDTVEEMLETIGVDTKPISVTRLGRYQTPKEGEKVGSRPLKVHFESQEVQQRVINGARNLQNAPENLRKISICYDMTEEERKKSKDMLEQAKIKSEQSSKYIYKIRGPPWALEEVQYRRRKNQENPNIISEEKRDPTPPSTDSQGERR